MAHTIEAAVRPSRRDAPESLKETFRPDGRGDAPRGRAGCRAPDAPAASCAKKGSTSAHEYSQRWHRKARQSRTRWFTMYAVLSSGRCSIAPVIPRIKVCPTRLGRLASAGLDPSIRGGTTRFYRPQQMSFVLRNPSSAHRHIIDATALPVQITRDTAASIASHSASVTIAIRPSCGTRRRAL